MAIRRERILERYPAVERLARVYAAIAFYLDHQPEIEAYLESARREFEASVGAPLSETNPSLWERLRKAKSGSFAAGEGEGPRA